MPNDNFEMRSDLEENSAVKEADNFQEWNHYLLSTNENDFLQALNDFPKQLTNFWPLEKYQNDSKYMNYFFSLSNLEECDPARSLVKLLFSFSSWWPGILVVKLLFFFKLRTSKTLDWQRSTRTMGCFLLLFLRWLIVVLNVAYKRWYRAWASRNYNWTWARKKDLTLRNLDFRSLENQQNSTLAQFPLLKIEIREYGIG